MGTIGILDFFSGWMMYDDVAMLRCAASLLRLGFG